MEKKELTHHRMTRRSAAHDYTQPGLYHITLHVADSLGQPLGEVVGSLSAPDGSADAPRTALSPVGQMVKHELLTAIHAHYAMISIQDFVIMPDHLHFIAVVQDKILSKRGKTVPLGTVIAGFKKGCNRRYWEIQGCSGETAAHTAPNSSAPNTPVLNTPAPNTPVLNNPVLNNPVLNTPAPAPSSVPVGFPDGAPSPGGAPPTYKVPSSAKSGRQPLFAPDFCDVMPVDERQLATQRAYIAANPRSRLQRSVSKALHTQRGGIATALTPSALFGYLRRECGEALTPEAWEDIAAQLLMAPDGTITCDTFGPRSLLAGSAALGHAVAGALAASTETVPAATPPHPLPVVCHRKDKMRFAQQKERCLEAAAQSAILVSPRIAKGEQEIITECVNHGFPVITIHDNGFPDRYHPSQERLDLCVAGRLLLVTPWRYQYRGKNEQITVPFCKTMNCVAQALCRTRDDWWKNKE